VVFLIAMQGFGYLPNIFFPPNDKAIMTAELTLPIGTPIERTTKIIGEIEHFMQNELTANDDRLEGIVDWATFIGESAPRFILSYNPEPPKPEFAVMLVNATSRATVDSLIERIEAFCDARYPDLRSDLRPLPLGPPIKAPVEVRISGPNVDRVFALADAVKAQLASMPGTKNIRDNWGARTKKLIVEINQPRARRAGLTSRDVAVSLQTVLTGLTTTEYREDDKVIPIVLRSVAAERDDIGKIESHNIYSQATGRSVPLKQVADVEVVWQPAKVLRRDRLRTVTVSCDVSGDLTPIAGGVAIQDWMNERSQNWGVGYRFNMGGEIETSGKANQSIMAKLPIAGLIILLLLVGQFNSIRKPLIIILTIPLGLIGVVIGLLLTGSYMGFMTFLGIISLAGIVINNAIVLLDRIRIEIDDNGLTPQNAIIEAAQRRLRPILLTTATTAGGLLPLWFGSGPMWQPMAIAIIFGLLFATVLTLGVVPVLYSLFFRVRYK
jgi:multidrug efflux pump subunit AcrB